MWSGTGFNFRNTNITQLTELHSAYFNDQVILIYDLHCAENCRSGWKYSLYCICWWRERCISETHLQLAKCYFVFFTRRASRRCEDPTTPYTLLSLVLPSVLNTILGSSVCHYLRRNSTVILIEIIPLFVLWTLFYVTTLILTMTTANMQRSSNGDARGY